MVNRIVSICFILFIVLTCAVFFVGALAIWFLTVFFDRRLKLLHMYTSFWGVFYIWTMPAWSITYEGREKIRKNATYVVVSNHQSQLDILAAFGLFFHYKWVSKIEIFRVPFVGWNMVLNRYIPLKRGDKESIQAMMEACEKTLAQGNSVYFFPEGTRSKTGEVKAFKPGAFILAQKMKLPILPIAISGTKDALPKHSMNFHGRHHFRVKVLDEIPYGRFATLSVEETTRMVRELIVSHLDRHHPTTYN